ncbi:asparagine-rich antigen, putative [Plasmodium berghei]|uniref:Asparagine-rich antigen, putative n=2 Tax=Plasmodium berghei TaxID=5821 RepID=A0A509AEB8_PLABA|nr:asparagine-rich antigen, putative [Plasmodium berghei ANKA]SCL90133.1 asparagine-rich antigen, putative [Plasmodium berghei]SCM15226.1 asparagine-rich antigen, putative [Plasmodium berghei]SCN21878.1 asparagine-rich antigen, putative [Plasmodium berghei]VUC53950.1 asparagine-rich antigen, putative [Plasmodium berghei ANKA]|eukprot:XP_034419802.1 asparagine-rich antigen, putative [Plasmodium berghei ANKA]
MHNLRGKEARYNKNKEDLNGLYHTQNSENHLKANKEKQLHSSSNNYKYIRDNQSNLVDYLSYNNYIFSNFNGNYNSRKAYYNKNLNNRYHKMHYNNENEHDYIGRSKNYNNNNNIFKDEIGYEKFNRRNHQNNSNCYYNNVDNNNEHKTMANELLPPKHKNELDKCQINAKAENELNNKKFKDIDKKNSHQNIVKKGNNRMRKNNFISLVPPQNNDNDWNVENQIIPSENENTFIEKKKKNYGRYKNNCKNSYSYNSNNSKGHVYFNESYNIHENYNYTRYNNNAENDSFSYRNNRVNSGLTKSRNTTSNYNNVPDIIGKNGASKSENIKCDTPSNIKFNGNNNGNFYNTTNNSNDYNLCINGYNNTKNSFDLFIPSKKNSVTYNSKKNMLDGVGANSEICCDKDKSMGFYLNKNNAVCQNKEQNNNVEKNAKNNMTAQEPIWNTSTYQKDKINIQKSGECANEKTNTISKLDETASKEIQANNGNNDGNNSRMNINNSYQYPDANHEENEQHNNGNNSKFVFNKNNYGKKNTSIKYYSNSYIFNYRNNTNTRYSRRKHISYDKNDGIYNANYYYKKLDIDCKIIEAYKDSKHRENCSIELSYIDEKKNKLENNKVDIKLVVENGDTNVLDDNICNSKLKDNEFVINEKKEKISKNQHIESYNSNNNKQKNVNVINEHCEHDNEKEDSIKINNLPHSTKNIECQLENIPKNAPILVNNCLDYSIYNKKNNEEENGNQSNSLINMDDNLCVPILKNNNTSLYNSNRRKNSKFSKNKMDITRVKNISLNTNKKQIEMNHIKNDTLNIPENKYNDNDALFLEKNDDTNNEQGIFTIFSDLGNDYTVFDIKKESTQSTIMICSFDGKSALNKTEDPLIQFGYVENESMNTLFNKSASINNSNVSIDSKQTGCIHNETLDCYKSELPDFKENCVFCKGGKKNTTSYTNKSRCSLAKSGDNFIEMKKKEVICVNEKKRRNRKKRKNILKNVKSITSNNGSKSSKINKALSFPENFQETEMRDNNVGENGICDGKKIIQRQRDMHNRSQSENIYNCKDNYIKNLEVSMTKPHMPNFMQSVNTENFKSILNKYIFNCDSNINDEETLFSCDNTTIGNDESEKIILDKYVHKKIGQTELKISLPHVVTYSSSINNNLPNQKEGLCGYNAKSDKCALNYEYSNKSNIVHVVSTGPHFDNLNKHYEKKYVHNDIHNIINKNISLKKKTNSINHTFYNFNGEFNCDYNIKTQNTFLCIYKERQNTGEQNYKINNKNNINEKDSTHFELAPIFSDEKTKHTVLNMKESPNGIDAKGHEENDQISHRKCSRNRKNDNYESQKCHKNIDLKINCDRNASNSKKVRNNRNNSINFMVGDLNDSHHQKKLNSKKLNISYNEKGDLKNYLAIEGESIGKNKVYINNTDINRVNNVYAENQGNKKNMNVNNNIYLKNNQNNSNTNNLNYYSNIGAEFNTNQYYNKFNNNNVVNSNTNVNKNWEGKHSNHHIGATYFAGEILNTHNFDTHKEISNGINNEGNGIYIPPYGGSGGNNNFCNNYNFNSSNNFGNCDNYTKVSYICNTTPYNYRSYNYSVEGNNNYKNANSRYHEVNKNIYNSNGNANANRKNLNNINRNGDNENSGYFFNNTKYPGINNYESVANTSSFIDNDNYINHNKSNNNGSSTHFNRSSRGNGNSDGLSNPDFVKNCEKNENDMNCIAKSSGKGNSTNYDHENYTKNWNGTFNYRNNYKMKTNYRFDNNYMDIRRKNSPNNMKKNVKKIWNNHKDADESEEKNQVVKKYNIYNSFTNAGSNKDDSNMLSYGHSEMNAFPKHNISINEKKQNNNKDINDNRTVKIFRETKNEIAKHTMVEGYGNGVTIFNTKNNNNENEKISYNKNRYEQNCCNLNGNESNKVKQDFGGNLAKDVVNDMVNKAKDGENNFKERNKKDAKEIINTIKNDNKATETYNRNRKFGGMINNNYKKNLIKKNKLDGENSNNIAINEEDNKLVIHKNSKEDCTNKKVGIYNGNVGSWKCYRNDNVNPNNSSQVSVKKNSKGYALYNKTYFKQNAKKNENVLFNNGSYATSSGKNCSPLSKNNKSNNNNFNFLKKKNNDNVIILDEEKQKVDAGYSASVVDQKKIPNVGTKDNGSYINENTLCNNKLTIYPDKSSKNIINGYANNIEIHSVFYKDSYNRKNSSNKNDSPC